MRAPIVIQSTFRSPGYNAAVGGAPGSQHLQNRAIDFAIERGLKTVEAGAQGQHKLARGYMPQFTYSAHWMADKGFRDAVARFLKDEGMWVESDQQTLSAHGPFKQSA